MSDGVIITAMICATILIIFHMGLSMETRNREEDDEE